MVETDFPYLKGFWSRKIANANDGANWVADNTLLCGLRIGLRETYTYLLQSRPSFEEFAQWILERNGGKIGADRIARLNWALSEAGIAGEPADSAAEPVLNADDLALWNKNGYIVVHDAVSPGNCQAAVDAICGFLDVDPERPETWYGGPQGHSIWIPLLHHPALWANRDAPRVRRAFAQLWGREDIWMNVDQAGFNPPERPGWSFPGPHLHWDVSLAQPVPFGVQGILYLADTAPDQGAFTCVPGFHRRIEEFLSGLPQGIDPRKVDLSPEAAPIAGRAGDLVIWHHALPHASSPNRSVRPRFVQYMIGRPSSWQCRTEWR